jgi:hypothetical protein
VCGVASHLDGEVVEVLHEHGGDFDLTGGSRHQELQRAVEEVNAGRLISHYLQPVVHLTNRIVVLVAALTSLRHRVRFLSCSPSGLLTGFNRTHLADRGEVFRLREGDGHHFGGTRVRNGLPGDGRFHLLGEAAALPLLL